MKKILLTENQMQRLVSFIMEDGEAGDKSKPKGDDFMKNVKYRSQEKLLKEIRDEFNNNLINANVCDDILFFIGKSMNKDGKEEIDSGSIKTLTLRLYSVLDDEVKTKVIDVKGGLPFKIDDLYSINLKNAFNLANDSAFIFLNKLTNVKDKDGKENEQTELVRLSDVLTTEIIENNGKCSTALPDVKGRATKLTKQYTAKLDSILRSQIYEPGMLGMDNIFFFPKGFKSMDKILSKYGLSVRKNNYEKSKVRFKLLDKPAKSSTIFKQGAVIIGTIDFQNNIVINNYYFKLKETDEISPEQEIDTKVYNKTKTGEIYLYPMRIRIISLSSYNDYGYEDNPIAQPETGKKTNVNEPTNSDKPGVSAKTIEPDSNINKPEIDEPISKPIELNVNPEDDRGKDPRKPGLKVRPQPKKGNVPTNKKEPNRDIPNNKPER